MLSSNSSYVLTLAKSPVKAEQTYSECTTNTSIKLYLWFNTSEGVCSSERCPQDSKESYERVSHFSSTFLQSTFHFSSGELNIPPPPVDSSHLLLPKADFPGLYFWALFLIRCKCVSFILLVSLPILNPPILCMVCI